MNYAVGRTGRIAAFFDLDGTILAEPSLERQFLARLRRNKVIPAKNYFLWLANALKLAPKGIGLIPHANKIYLRGVSSAESLFRSDREPEAPEIRIAARRTSHQCLQPTPSLFPDALDQVAWHAMRGHAIFFITGTLAPLASEMALAVTVRLALRGITTSIGVCATQLEQAHGRWTGRVVGEALFAQGKARAMWRLAASTSIDLARSYAYANSASDRWMLGAVGRPAAVNPSPELVRLAHLRGWPILSWKDEKHHAKTTVEDQSAQTPSGSQTCRAAALSTTKSEILG